MSYAFQVTKKGPLTIAWLDDFDSLNQSILKAYDREAQGQFSRHSHLELGRYENTYIDISAIPEFQPLADAVKHTAQTLLQQTELKMGFWFNAMQPGDKTARHNHDEEDELLSCVYYITAPQNSGDLLLFDCDETLRVTPEAGKLVLFAPKLAHAVEENRSDQQRLSVAFNFGLAAS